jgi:dihydroorotate dehydrogenase
MININSVTGRITPIRWLIRLLFKNRRDERLVQNYYGIEFVGPVGLPAGYDKSGRIVPIIASLGFGFGTVGSVTAEWCSGNPKPWFFRLPKAQSLAVNAGLSNDGSDVIIKRVKRYSPKAIKRFPVILSIAKTNSRKVVDTDDGIADYIKTIMRAKNEQNIKIIELNISCPNTYGGEPFTTPDRLDLLLTAVDNAKTGQPIFIKMPVDLPWVEFKSLLNVAVKHQISGVTIANLTRDRASAVISDNLPDTVRGNFGGKLTWQSSNELIRKTYLDYSDKLTIIGVGGIFSAEDAYTKIKLGASLVELVTGMIFCGPQLPSEINDGLLCLLERDGFKHISQAIGVDAKDGKLS